MKAQLDIWKTWIDQVVAGKHDDYVRRLHMHTTSDFLRYHWSYLRAYAGISAEQDSDSSNRGELTELRQQILLLAEPIVTDVPIDVTDSESRIEDDDYEEFLDDVKKLAELTRAWNSIVEYGLEIPDYGDDYEYSLDEFKKNHAKGEWLNEFFQWADRCVENRFGLYLDY